MLSDEINARADAIEASSNDPMVQAMVLVARTLNEVNWNMTYIKKHLQAEREEVTRIRQELERTRIV